MKYKTIMCVLAAAILGGCSYEKDKEYQEDADNELATMEYKLETQEDVERYFSDFNDYTVKYLAVATAYGVMDDTGEWQYSDWEPCEFDIILNCDLAALCVFTEDFKVFYLDDFAGDSMENENSDLLFTGKDHEDRDIEVSLQTEKEGMMQLCITYSTFQVLYKMIVTRSSS